MSDAELLADTLAAVLIIALAMLTEPSADTAASPAIADGSSSTNRTADETVVAFSEVASSAIVWRARLPNALAAKTLLATVMVLSTKVALSPSPPTLTSISVLSESAITETLLSC